MKPITHEDYWHDKHGPGADMHGPEFTASKSAWDASISAERMRVDALYIVPPTPVAETVSRRGSITGQAR